MGRRSRLDAESKMAIVLEGLRGEGCISEVCRRHSVAQAQYYRWRDQFLSGGKAALGNGHNGTEEVQKQKIKELEKIIGRLTVQNEILKKLET